MNNIIALLFISLLFSSSAQSLQFDWAKGIGNGDVSAGTYLDTDAEQNVYVVGFFDDTTDFDPGSGVYELAPVGLRDVFLLKLTKHGDFVWARSWGGLLYDHVWSVKVDNSGNVLLCGTYNDTMDFDPGTGVDQHIAAAYTDMFLIKMDANGNYVWGKTFDNNDVSETAIAVDTDVNDNVYLAGSFHGTVDLDPSPGTQMVTAAANNSDAYLLKLDASGNFIWAKSHGGTDDEDPKSMNISTNGYIYVFGEFKSTTDLDPGPGTANFTSLGDADSYVQKFDLDGNLIWAKAFGGSSFDMAICSDIDEDDNIYTSGYFAGNIDLDPGTGTDSYNAPGAMDWNIYIQKLDSSGNFVWGGVIASTSGGEQPRDIHITADNEILLAGYSPYELDLDPGTGTQTLTPNGGHDIFLLNLDTSGIYNWHHQYGSDDQDYPRCVSTDNEGSVLMCGEFKDTLDFDFGPAVHDLYSTNYDCFVLKIAPEGLGFESTIDNSVTIYPNPTNGQLNIKLGEDWNKASVYISDISGRVIESYHFNDHSNIQFNLEQPNGIYFIRVISGDKEITKKVVKY